MLKLVSREKLKNLVHDLLGSLKTFKKGPENVRGERIVRCDSKDCKRFSKYICTIVEDTSGYMILDDGSKRGEDYDEDMWNNTYHFGCPKNGGA